jgi:hypothetical protein
MHRTLACSLIAPLLCSAFAAAQDAPKPDPFSLPEGYSNARRATDGAAPAPAAAPGELQSYATLHSLGFEWDLGLSDTDHDATCRAAYRRVDEKDWHDALPLFRVDYFGWYSKTSADKPYNMLAGSILFLRPGTEYVVRLTLADPDGGGAERELKLATRPIPDYGTPERTLHVVPKEPVPRKADDTAAAGDGSAQNPFRGVEEADKAARPGDLMLLRAGDYGAAVVTRSGTPAPAGVVGGQPKYVVWKAAGDGSAVIHRAFSTASAVWFEGLDFVHTDEKTGLRAGDEPNADVVVRANRFRGFSYSVYMSAESRRWYVADNDIVGDSAGGIAGEGVEMHKSSDHTVCYNRAVKVADGTSYCKRNCDVFGNEFLGVSDDGIEPDYGYANNRMWGNRLSGHAGITFQPMYCGPWYVVRNQIISNVNIFKLRVQDRYLVTNNTLVGYAPEAGAKIPHAHGLLTAMMRNNLWIHGGGSPFLWAVQVPRDEKQRDYVRNNVLFDSLKADWRTDIDYDGFDWSSADGGKRKIPTPFVWNGARLENLTMLADSVGIERHGRVVAKEEIFEQYSPPPYDLEKPPTFTLRTGGEAADAGAVDGGMPLPNIAEEFAGKSPDLGAFEAGDAVPHTGPRTGPDWRKTHAEWVLKHQR